MKFSDHMPLGNGDSKEMDTLKVIIEGSNNSRESHKYTRIAWWGRRVGVACRHKDRN